MCETQCGGMQRRARKSERGAIGVCPLFCQHLSGKILRGPYKADRQESDAPPPQNARGADAAALFRATLAPPKRPSLTLASPLKGEECSINAVFGFGGDGVGDVDPLADFDGAVFAADWLVKNTFTRLQFPLEKRDVFLMNLVLLHRARPTAGRFGVFCQRENTGGLAIETMQQMQLRQIFSGMLQITEHGMRNDFVRGMREQTGRFIDDQEIIIFKENRDVSIFGKWRFRFTRVSDADVIPGTNFRACAHQLIISRDTRFQRIFWTRARV